MKIKESSLLRLNSLEKKSWLLLFALSGVTIVFSTPHLTVSTFLGGALIILDFRIIRTTIEELFIRKGRLKVYYLVLFVFRLLVLAAALLVLLSYQIVIPSGFLIGLSALPLGIIGEALVMLRKQERMLEI